ncbi:MAG: hypothetical protein IJS22_09830 [Lachnospiraceae bacterium]|nr:hypothetical protein [Lachnospiraceae bacterium]
MYKKIAAYILCLIILTLTACGGESTASPSRVLYSVGSVKVPLSEAMFFAAGQKDLLEDTYGAQIWSVDMGDMDFGSFLGDRIRTAIALTYAGEGLAASRGIALSVDDKTLVTSAADYYYTGLSKQFISSMNITPDDVRSAFTAYRLARKGHEQLIDDADIEVSRDEARVMTLAQIRINIRGLEGDALSEKRSRIEEAASRLAEGEDFLAVAAEYNEAPATQLTVSRDDLSSSEERVAFGLGYNEISPVSENAEWLFIFKCLNMSDDTLSAARRSQLLSSRQEEYYISELKTFLTGNPSVWNDELWDSLDISSIDIGAEYNFYSVYDMFFPEV